MKGLAFNAVAAVDRALQRGEGIGHLQHHRAQRIGRPGHEADLRLLDERGAAVAGVQLHALVAGLIDLMCGAHAERRGGGLAFAGVFSLEGA